MSGNPPYDNRRRVRLSRCTRPRRFQSENRTEAKVGLWGDPHPVQPQDFRHGTNSPLLYDASGCRRSSEPSSGPVLGNGHSHIFEWPGCPYYDAISPDNRVPFPSPQAAETAGYRPAHNCP